MFKTNFFTYWKIIILLLNKYISVKNYDVSMSLSIKIKSEGEKIQRNMIFYKLKKGSSFKNGIKYI